MAGSLSNPAPAWNNEYDANLTKQIINSQHILHVSFLTKNTEYPPVISSAKSSNTGTTPKSFEEGDPEIRISIAASTAHSHYLGFSGFATGFTFANTALNGTATLMKVSDDNHAEREWIMKHIINSQIPDAGISFVPSVKI
ncbi:hypothetical protein sscle_02g015800 [Sclerotinia sclerotiorum 1980 UF-70]|uniref:Uncharacterized protein n=1 Tax=Sclerotinia sclerotiorum (strain ATCC 18683 / 1980 / Ss-1) TaxID=665079 RepID=A0A1D9PVU7_SCLS1|nr:hypothetical protein sscle_02g015800 [Sclerotinia sclerotiorum 1980 UF-70]